MSAIDNILGTMRSQERIVEGLVARPLGVQSKINLPPGPAGILQRMRSGGKYKLPGGVPKGITVPSNPFVTASLPLRPSVDSQTPSGVPVITI